MKNPIVVLEDKCVGCNKCVQVCQIPGANVARKRGKEYIMTVDGDRCVACGECVKACDHGARIYHDDTERFFRDLAAGKKISVLAAPSVAVNLPQYRKLFGWLKTRGALGVYDVSFGADITTWAYLKAIGQKRISTMISQPCPAVVSYIEKYCPDLIPYLAPVQSPMMCAAVYLKRYCGVEDALAFLSPCIAKKTEMEDPDTGGYVSYNVTFRGLLEYLRQNQLDYTGSGEADFDGPAASLGSLYSLPGGLKANVEARTESCRVEQVEGTREFMEYLKEYGENLKSGYRVPNLVDVLNCGQGCNLGTASMCTLSKYEVREFFRQMEQRKKAERSGTMRRKFRAVDAGFSRKLKPEDFERAYTDRRVADFPKPGPEEKEQIFQDMLKTTEAGKSFNCSACGYSSCDEMVTMLRRNGNHDLQPYQRPGKLHLLQQAEGRA